VHQRPRKDRENAVADTLSPCVEELAVDPTELLGFETTVFTGEEYWELVKDVEQNLTNLPDLKIEDGLIFKRVFPTNLNGEVEEAECKLWIPQSLTHSIIERALTDPTAAHGGMGKTVEILRMDYYWPGVAIQVRYFVWGCEVCKESTAPIFRMELGIGERVQTEQPFQKLYIDILRKYIVVDHFSKYTFLKALKEATATSNVEDFRIHEIFFKLGIPEVVHSDNGRQFTSKIFEEAIESFGITHLKTPIYSPQSNAVERVNRSVLAAIRGLLDGDHRDWDAYLPEI